jgi:hypothetical protein
MPVNFDDTESVATNQIRNSSPATPSSAALRGALRTTMSTPTMTSTTAMTSSSACNESVLPRRLMDWV